MKVNKRLHKMVIIATLMIAIIEMSHVECSAQEQDLTPKVESKINSIIDEFYHALPEEFGDITDIQSAGERVGVKSVLGGVIRAVKGRGSEISVFLLTLLGISMMSTLGSLAGSEIGTYSTRAVGVVSSALLFERLLFLVTGATESLNEIGDFFGAVIPVSIAVNSFGVSPTTASMQAVGMGVTLGAYSFISRKVLTVVASAIFVTSAASGIDPMFSRISKSVKNVFLWLIGIFSVLVGATFSLQSVIAASADSAVVRGARFAISGSVPIVGNTVSGALGIVTGGVSYARGLVGGGAIAVIITLMLTPLVTLFLYRICLRIGIFLCSICSVDGLEGVLASFSGAVDAILATYALTITVYIVELLAFLKGGASIA